MLPSAQYYISINCLLYFRLCRTFLLIDAEVGLISTDEIALEMLQEVGVSYVVSMMIDQDY